MLECSLFVQLALYEFLLYKLVCLYKHIWKCRSLSTVKCYQLLCQNAQGVMSRSSALNRGWCWEAPATMQFWEFCVSHFIFSMLFCLWHLKNHFRITYNSQETEYWWEFLSIYLFWVKFQLFGNSFLSPSTCMNTDIKSIMCPVTDKSLTGKNLTLSPDLMTKSSML